MKKRLSIIWQIIVAISAILIAFIIIFTLYTRQIIAEMDKQLASGYQQSLKTYTTNLQTEMRNADIFLNVNCWSNSSFYNISEEKSFAKAQQLLQSHKESAGYLLDANSELSAIAFSIPSIDYSEILYSQDVLESDEQGKALQEIFKTAAQDDSKLNSAWGVYSASNESYMCHTISRNGVVASALVRINLLAARAQTKYQLSSPVVFVNRGVALNTPYWIRDIGGYDADITQGDGYWTIAGKARKYLVVASPFQGMQILYAVPYTYSWRWLIYTIVVIVIITALVLSVAWLILRTGFFVPLKSLVGVMTRVRAGDTNARANVAFNNNEFSQINDSFNNMLDKINALKIEAYEQQLQAERSEMNALRLQIRRHFFLNCLKNLYSMTNFGNIKDMQSMILHLSTYLRYTLDITHNEVNFKTELQMCKHYIELQGIGQELKPQCKIIVDDHMSQLRLPPISILALLENSCKYAALPGKTLMIEIKAQALHIDELEYAKIVIADSGPGFPPQMLSVLNNNLSSISELGHVGLVNIMERLRLLYGNDCSIMFSNLNGAQIELMVPLKKRIKDEAINS